MARFKIQVAVARDLRNVKTKSLQGGKIVMIMLQLVLALTGIKREHWKENAYSKIFQRKLKIKSNHLENCSEKWLLLYITKKIKD